MHNSITILIVYIFIFFGIIKTIIKKNAITIIKYITIIKKIKYIITHDTNTKTNIINYNDIEKVIQCHLLWMDGLAAALSTEWHFPSRVRWRVVGKDAVLIQEEESPNVAPGDGRYSF